MKIALLGYGKMGKTVEKLATADGHQIVFTQSSDEKTGNLNNAEVVIEFSTPEIAFQNISEALEIGIPVVSGTTGWLDRYDEIVALCKKKDGSFIHASNFSIGVNLFFAINSYAAQLMAKLREYRVSLEEIHHLQKKDAPSGTAIHLAENILEHAQEDGWVLNKKQAHKISIHAKREADVKGTHIVTYDSAIDRIELKHEAHSRDGFAKGAILAAIWLKDKKGVFSMKDVLGI